MATRSVAPTESPPPDAARGDVRAPGRFKRWLLEGYIERPEAFHADRKAHQTQPWWKVMCLTGVDYFSTLGYQPGIAFLAASYLSPIATLVLVLLTLLGALPIYRRVARESPHGEGSIAMLQNLLRWWQGKLFVLALLGFVATDFIITITLSAADATAHLVENPFLHHHLEGNRIGLTLLLIALLGAVFLKGFKEAIGIAVVLVAVFLLLNAIVLGHALRGIVAQPKLVPEWWHNLLASRGGNPALLAAAALLVFPKLALGLSGFETGVAVMPLVKGNPTDTEQRAEGRIRNTRKLLTCAALIMSVFLLGSSLVTTLLIPAHEFRPPTIEGGHDAGSAYGRALAYLAHARLGHAFGTVYDVSTILILWFAGASAMAGLLNIVPRYLPRYGMAPEWACATRPLVIVYIAIAFGVTILFKADVNAQGGAYATGVLVLMTSASFAVTISARRRRSIFAAIAFGLITLVFLYTTVVNVIERPDGVKIASFFILAIVLVSFVSRIVRSMELRTTRIELDATAKRFVDEAVRVSGNGALRIVPNRPETRDKVEYDREEHDAREDHEIPTDEPLLFLEVDVSDPSEFRQAMQVRGADVDGHRVLRVHAPAIPNAIAALLLHLRDLTGRRPHAYFNWTEGNPLLYLIRYILSGEGEIAPVTREILRQHEPDPQKRPAIHAAM
jgi:hypothetical protein